MEGLMSATHPKIMLALKHVQSVYPEVTEVSYDEELRWEYKHADGTIPIFDIEKLDFSLLEAAVDEAYERGLIGQTLPSWPRSGANRD